MSLGPSKILVIDDDDLMREYVEESLTRSGHEVSSASSGTKGVSLLESQAFDIVVTDLKMTPMDGIQVVQHIKAQSPDTCCIVMTAYGTIDTAVEAMKEGADDYILKPFSPDELELAIARIQEKLQLAEENRYLRKADNQGYYHGSMIGDSKVMKKVYAQVQKVARSKSTVFVQGESGTGKELIARAIHHLGNRSEKPFIKVNCAALSAGLLESELFGHEKGSFTGASERKIGRFELSNEGTLLLDEVSEISSDLQPKLLRALQEREIDRVGGIHSIPVDTRIVATTNRDLEKAVEENNFREDLFFRLNVIPIQLPSLRDRKDDIPALMVHFLNHYEVENGLSDMSFTPEVHNRFLDYDWPGNVRELQNTIERAVVLASGPELTVDDFNQLGTSYKKAKDEGGIKAGMSVAAMERELIFKTLEKCNNNRTRAAEVLDISVRTLRNKLKEYSQSSV